MKFKKDGEKIIKYEFEAEYDLEKVKEGYKKIEEMIKALEAEMGVEKAKVVNIEELHEIVKTLKEEDVVAVCLWQEAKGRAKQKEDKINELKEILADADNELKQIKQQLGVEIWKTKKTK